MHSNTKPVCWNRVAQGSGRKSALSRFIEETGHTYLLECTVDQAKTVAIGMSETDLTDLIDEAVQWARQTQTHS